MIKSLRNKFIIVTTSLMVALFGGFLIINTMYNQYWNDLEIAEMLEWIAGSGVFTSVDEGSAADELVFNITENEKPIIGIILDENGNTLYRSVLGGEEDVFIKDETLSRMCEYKDSRYKVGQFIYSYSEITSDRVLLVIMDSQPYEHKIRQIFSVVVLSIGGVGMLILITFVLSRFVTEPAEKSLIREKRFISDASHELKTPLGAISINAQALETEYADNLYVKNIISESNRMARLIEKLLTLSRFDEIENVEFVETSLSDLCEEMALTYEGLAYEKGLNYEYNIEPDLKIKGNEDELRQLMAILIDNALKNADENGKVDLFCGKERNCGIIRVSNTGEGINEDDLPHIFDRFYTTDSSRDKNSFGLGLAIAKSIVERHKGEISVKSKEKEYTVFNIILRLDK